MPVYQEDRRREIGDRGSRLKRVLILNPDHFQAIVDNHTLMGWRYNGRGRQGPLASQVFLPEEVWHDKLPNPFDHWRGISPLCARLEAAERATVRAIDPTAVGWFDLDRRWQQKG